MNSLQRLLDNSTDSFKYEFQSLARMKDTPRLKAFLRFANKTHGGITDPDAIMQLVLAKDDPAYLVLGAVCLNKPLHSYFKEHSRDQLRVARAKLSLPLVYFCPTRECREISCLWLHSNILVIRDTVHLFNDNWHTKITLNGLEEL